MTDLLKAAFERINRLPPEEQDSLARLLLEEIESESGWDQRFQDAPEKLASLADAARDEISRADVFEEDPGTRRGDEIPDD